MRKNINVPVLCAGMSFFIALGAGPLGAAQAKSADEDGRVMSMGKDPEEKAAADAGDWDEIVKANNYDKLTANDKQLQKAELAEDFDEDLLERERLRDWYGASEDCSGQARLPTHKELLKMWDAECKESTSAVCSAVYWTSEKKGDRALGVNFLNGYVIPKDLDSFAYVRCAGGKQGRKPAAARPSAKTAKKKGRDPSSKIVDLVRNYLPVPDGPRLEEKLSIMIAGAGGSAGAINWEVRKKGPGLFLAVAVVPLSEGEIKYTFSVNTAKKTVTPVDARARAVFKAITDPDIAEGDMR